jgi:predicted flavoprotein YhiN
VRQCQLRLTQPRPINEAISSAGGIDWGELNDELMLRRYPGVFCAGEMIDWDAPTGGYLLQGCYATGNIAGEGAAKWIAQHAQA